MELYVIKIGGVSNQPFARILCVTPLIRIIYIMLNKGAFAFHQSQYEKPLNALFSMRYTVFLMLLTCRLRIAKQSETTKRVV